MNFKKVGESESEDSLNFRFKLDSQIYEPVFKTVERIARKHTRGTSVSWEDAKQVAHIKVLQATQAGMFRQGGVEEFHHWAATVARFAIIDYIRKQKQSDCQSLYQNVPGTELSLLDTVADEFDLLDAVERTDLVLKAIEAITELDHRYPNRGYLKLWQGLKQGKNQSQLAAELGMTQGTISKRWKELCKTIAEMLGLFETENIKQELQVIRKQKTVRKPNPPAPFRE